MKKETLARRISEKSGVPLLEKVILGKAAAHDLPDYCIPWTGKVSGAREPRFRKRRDYDNLQYLLPTVDHPRPIIRFQKRDRGVHQLLFKSLIELDYPYRLQNTCGTAASINPLHLVPKEIRPAEWEPIPDENSSMALGDDWSLEEVEEVVEIALTEYQPKDWEELSSLEVMQDAPPKQVEVVLRQLNRLHLLPDA